MICPLHAPDQAADQSLAAELAERFPVHAGDLRAMPAALQQLLLDELRGGNAILEVGHVYPAPPIGATVMLARPVSTRPRASGEGLRYRERSSSLYSGEFTDDAGIYFVLEPPDPPPPEVDMDALRAEHNAWHPAPRPSIPGGSAAAATFLRSMELDYFKWHDGEMYDMDALRHSSPSEWEFFLTRLVPAVDVRDVEALAELAKLGMPAALAALRSAMASTNPEVRLAVGRYAPSLVDDATRSASIVRAMESVAPFGGLAPLLDEVADFHPPVVVDALFRGLLHQNREVACHFAAMLAYVHGKADSIFDWSMRPLFLEFNTTDRTERLAAFRALCETLEIASEPLLATLETRSTAAAVAAPSTTLNTRPPEIQ